MRILLDPAGGEGNGAPTPAPDYAAALAKHNGDANALAATMFAQANQLRADRDRAVAELAEARKAIPAEGARVLSAEDVARFDALAELGDPAEVKARLAEGDATAGRLKAHERRELIREAAKAHGLNPAVLEKLAGPDLAIEVKDATRDGKPARVAEVVVAAKDADGKEVQERKPLAKYAEAAWPEFKASLFEPRPSPGHGSPSPYQPPRMQEPAAPNQPFVNVA